MAKARGRETLAIGVLLVCILVGNPGGVGGATDQNDGEWFQILSCFFSFLFLERKREPSFLLLFFWVESLSSRIYISLMVTLKYLKHLVLRFLVHTLYYFLLIVEQSFIEMKTIQASSASHTAILPPPAPISLKPPPIERHKSFDEDDFSNKPLVKKANTTPIKAAIYSVADLQIATDSFSIDNLVGEGSFGRVYKAQFSDGKVIFTSNESIMAVKKINSSALSNQLPDCFIELVSNISRLHHPNLCELVGYCSEHGQHLLIYEFYKNGSLHDLLHLSDEYSKSLSWNARVKIALGTARALE
ncbi:hypothetical protein BHE74_00023891 [Ensete ventricosum]|nr:hypothetical protein BHE74_00023891 [Ensete ventricosum]